MSDRDELAALIYQHSAGDYEPWMRETAESSADAILARWRLVPVEQHVHKFTVTQWDYNRRSPYLPTARAVCECGARPLD